MIGLETARHLPNASTFCGKCEEVCPMRIPLPAIMRHWREQAHEQQITPPLQRWGIEAWAFAARRPWLYRLGTRIAIAALHMLGTKQGGRFTRSEEHTSELQSLMRISYAAFCLKKTITHPHLQLRLTLTTTHTQPTITP